MTWLTWRQFRNPAYVAIGGLAFVALALAITPEGHGLTRCFGAQGCPFATTKVLGVSHDHLLKFLSTFLVGLPALVGIFWGAPLIARELDAGTHRMVWTQSVTRYRWLAVKLTVVGLATVAVCGLFSLMLGLWSPEVIEKGRLLPPMFAERGIVPIGYGLFALAVGVVAGLVIRRTVPAMAATLVAFVAARMAVQYGLRAHLIPATHGTVAVGRDLGIEQTPSGLNLSASTASIPNGWVNSVKLVDNAGHAPSTAFIQSACGAPLPPPVAGNGTHRVRSGEGMQACVRTVAAHFHEVVTYHPASDYWPLQLAETGIFLALAAVIIGFGFWRIGRTS